MGKTEWTGYCGGSEKAEGVRRIHSSTKGKCKIYVMVDDNGDPRTDEQTAKLCEDSFLRRPSLKPQAINTICGFMNNVILARKRPAADHRYNAAMFFIFKNQAAWVISGDAAVFFFEDGKLVKRSAERGYPHLGSAPSFKAEPEAAFPLPEGNKALFMCSSALLKLVGVVDIEDALTKSDDPVQWMDNILGRCGMEEPEVSAIAAFLPPPRKGMLGFLSKKI